MTEMEKIFQLRDKITDINDSQIFSEAYDNIKLGCLSLVDAVSENLNSKKDTVNEVNSYIKDAMTINKLSSKYNMDLHIPEEEEKIKIFMLKILSEVLLG